VDDDREAGTPDDLGFRPTVPSLLAHACAEYGGVDLLVGPDYRLTFADVDALSRRLAVRLLERGVGKGTRLGLMFPNGPAAVGLFLAAARIGAFVMPLSTLARPAEVRATLALGDVAHVVVPPVLFGRDHLAFFEEALPTLRSSGPRLSLPEVPYLRHVWTMGPSERPWAADLDQPGALEASGRAEALLEAIEAEVTPADWLVTIWTSGTTSAPKGVVHTHGVQVRHSARLARLFGVARGERILAGLPFFWVGGLTLTLLGALHGGATLLCVEKLDPDVVLALADRERPTRISVWSRRALERIVSHPDVDRCDPEAVAPFRRSLESPVGNPRFHNSLGMSETSGPHTGVPIDDLQQPLPERLWGSFGRPLPGVEHRVVDPVTGTTRPPGSEGELCVRGDSLMQGLYKRERHETFDPAGWFATGDLGYFEDGYLFFVGRRNDMIKTSGSNVAPLEVEVVLAGLPEVKMAFVFGVPDELLGEAVVAAVVPEGPDGVDPARLIDDARRLLAPYKVPGHVVVLGPDDVPYLMSGKPDVRRIRQQVRNEIGRPEETGGRAVRPAGPGPVTGAR